MKVGLLIFILLIGCSKQGNLKNMPGTGKENDNPIEENISLSLKKITNKISVVDLSLGKINCSYNCANKKENYPKSSDIVLQATLIPGYEIGSWSGCDQVLNDLCLINKITQSRTVTITLANSCTSGYTYSTGNCLPSIETYQANYTAFGSCSATNACSGVGIQSRAIVSCDKLINGVKSSVVANSFCSAYNTVGYLTMPCNSPAGNINVSIPNGSNTVSCPAGSTTETIVSTSCNASYSSVNNSCVMSNQSRSCSISNGVGNQSSTDGGQTYSSCTVASCNSSYTQIGNTCVLSSQSRSCSIANGTGTQSSIDGGQSYSSCAVSSCNSSYSQVGNSCELTNQTRSCQNQPNHSTGGTESSTDGGQTWGTCSSFTCSNGYVINSSTCVVDNTLLLNKQISAGEIYSCAISSFGKAYCWGENASGQLGNNTTTDSKIPIEVSTSGVLSGKTVKQISIGDSTPCVIASDDLAYCWGYGLEGQLGNGTSSNSSVPVAVSRSGVLSGKTIKWLSSGYGYTCVVASDNKGYCWGYNNAGQLGNNSTTDSNVPVAVNTSGLLSGKDLLYITAGYDHACALTTDHKVFCWGNNNVGQLGNNSWSASLTPVEIYTAGVLAGKNISFISNYLSKTTCILADNKPYCWGQNGDAQIGNNTYSDSNIPLAVDTSGVLSGKNFKTIATGNRSSCVIDSTGKAYCWGNNASGTLGNGDQNIHGVPVAVSMSGINFNSLSVGHHHACATATNGKAYCWGNNFSGELGNNSTSLSTTPSEVLGINF